MESGVALRGTGKAHSMFANGEFCKIYLYYGQPKPKMWSLK